MKQISVLLFAFFLALNSFAQTETPVATAEAEKGVFAGGVTTSTAISGYSGTGYVTNFKSSADKVTVTVNVPTKAYYKIVIRYAAPNGQKNQKVAVNGAGTTSVVFKAINTFSDVDAGKYLFSEGSNTISLQSEWGWIEIDKFSVYSTDNSKNSYAIAADPVNPAATAETKALYDFLRSNFNKKIISGQTNDWYDKVKQITGKSPLLRVYDFQHYTQGYAYKWVDGGHTFGAEDDGSVKAAIDWYNKTGKKGIVGFQWHWHSPFGGKAGTNTFYTEYTTFDVTKAVVPGNQENTKIIEDIDAIAAQLKRFQDAKVPVLWRPLHEAGGGWFWWGAKGADACKKLYDIIFDRMTNYHKLNNLIWVWSTPEADWYPGNSKIDMVGHDSYPGAFNYDTKKNDFDILYKITAGQKLIALTENGPIPNPDDCLLLDAPWSLFMTWSDFLTKENSTQHVKDVYANQNVLTLETVTGVEDIIPGNPAEFLIYPNPATGKVTIADSEYQRLEIIDLNGKNVFFTNSPVKFIQTDSLKNGIYIVKIYKNKKVFQQKLVVSN
jgi:mannan endo-1,4-beta-mannosidase